MRLRTTCCIISALFCVSCGTTGSGRQAPVRVVTLKVVADRALMESDPRWHDTAADLVQAASDYLEGEFGIRLTAQTIESWSSPPITTSSVALMQSLRQSYPRTGGTSSQDIIIGLTRQRVNFYDGGRARADRIGNCNEGLGNYIVSYVTSPFIYGGPDGELTHDVLALVHETGHLFGAEHTDDPASVMNRSFEFRTGFDDKNRAVMMKNRFCRFAGG